MSASKEGLTFVAAPASGWCEPETGVCHIDSADAPDDAVTAEAADEGAAVDEAVGAPE